MDLSNNQPSKKQKSNLDDESEDESEYESEESESCEEEVQVQVQVYEPTYNNADLLDSIAIARETYFFTYMDEENEIDSVSERDVLKFIYEQIANTWTDVSLLEILGHIKHYYTITFPEHGRIVELFYLSVYPQALMTDRVSAGFVQMNSQGHEIPNSFIGVSNTNFNPSNPFASIFSNIINPPNIINPDISYNMIVNEQNRPQLSSPNSFLLNQPSMQGSSLLSEIMFLSTVFNMRSNESLLHILNLMNNILDRTDEEKQTADPADIKGLGTQEYSTVGLDHKDKNSEFCTICQENYSDDSQIKILPCGHFYHCECIEPWLLNCSNLCPICRKKI